MRNRSVALAIVAAILTMALPALADTVVTPMDLPDQADIAAIPTANRVPMNITVHINSDGNSDDQRLLDSALGKLRARTRRVAHGAVTQVDMAFAYAATTSDSDENVQIDGQTTSVHVTTSDTTATLIVGYTLTNGTSGSFGLKTSDSQTTAASFDGQVIYGAVKFLGFTIGGRKAYVSLHKQKTQDVNAQDEDMQTSLLNQAVPKIEQAMGIHPKH